MRGAVEPAIISKKAEDEYQNVFAGILCNLSRFIDVRFFFLM